ncbi:MAG: hypothetical protein WKF50_04975 [Nocardioides sp.]
MTTPSPRVLDLFAVPDDAASLPGGSGDSVHAGDLVLSPGRDPEIAAWLHPLLARLAVRLDERPRRRSRDLRIAVPVPARDGSWVVDGWGASRYEPGTVVCRDLDVLTAAGRVLHAELAVAVPERPPGLDKRDDRWAEAERLAFGPPEYVATAADRRGEPGLRSLAADVVAGLGDATGPDQLVHGDLAGNVLLDRAGAPVVIDVSPYWRPVLWAEAVCVLDAVLWLGAEPSVMTDWSDAARRDAMCRAALFRVLSDRPCDVAAYRRALQPALPN